jgi:adenylosuccinate synthase
LDILSSLKELKVAIAYKLNGKVLDSFPASIDTLANVEVVYETFEGWNESLDEFRKFEQLPENAQKYIKFIEEFLKVPGMLFLLFKFLA